MRSPALGHMLPRSAEAGDTPSAHRWSRGPGSLPSAVRRSAAGPQAGESAHPAIAPGTARRLRRFARPSPHPRRAGRLARQASSRWALRRLRGQVGVVASGASAARACPTGPHRYRSSPRRCPAGLVRPQILLVPRDRVRRGGGRPVEVVDPREGFGDVLPARVVGEVLGVPHDGAIAGRLGPGQVLDLHSG